jgi:hypothetical protein
MPEMPTRRDIRPDSADYVKCPKCPYCGRTTVHMLFEDVDEGFWTSAWVCNCFSIMLIEDRANRGEI